MNEKLKKFLSSRGFKAVSISLIVGCSIGGAYISGFENGRGLPATYVRYSKNDTLATVGKTKIKVDALKTHMEMFFASEPQKKFTDEEIAETEQMYVDYIVTREGLKQKALAEDLKVADEIIDSQYNELVPNLEKMYDLTIDELLSKYKLTEAYIKQSIEDELLGNSYLDKVSSVTDDEAKKYYNDNPGDFIECEASHILFKTVDDNYEPVSDSVKQVAKKQAQEVLEKALAGEDFATLAKEYSQDASAQDGGSLGYFKKGEMVEEFETAVFNLKAGEISAELVETQFGYHIIKKTGENALTAEDSMPTIKDNLKYEKKYNKMKEILESPDVKIEYTK